MEIEDDIKVKKRINISNKVKQDILNRQSNKCANNPDNNAVGVKGYCCPMWLLYDGVFDEAAYDIDHIIEHSDKGTNHINNLQALCPSCHRVKTNRYVSQKKPKYMPKLNSLEMHEGIAYMDIEDVNKKKPGKKRKTS